MAADDWLFTPALALSATQRYQVSFYYRVASGSFPERLEVKYGTAATPAGQANLLYTNNNITNAAYALATNISTPVVLDILRPLARTTWASTPSAWLTRVSWL